MDTVATGNQLPNPQTHFFHIIWETRETTLCHFARQHCTLSSSSAEVTQVQDPSFGDTFQTEDTCTFSFPTCVEQHLQQLPIGISIVLINAKCNWICVFKLDYQAKKTKQKEIMTITLLHILKALFRNSTFPRLHRKTHFLHYQTVLCPSVMMQRRAWLHFSVIWMANPLPNTHPKFGPSLLMQRGVWLRNKWQGWANTTTPHHPPPPLIVIYRSQRNGEHLQLW